MGCDIHLWAEYYSTRKKEWKLAVAPSQRCEYCKGKRQTTNPKTKKRHSCFWCRGRGRYSPRFYDGRCYDDFAILADVRNGHGFAGIKTGEGFNPISAPRGLPSNATDYVKARAQEMGEDGHSHSYLTLKDLLDYDWEQHTGHEGIVSAHVYYDWWKNKNRKGPPATWCGDITGPSVIKVSMAEMEKKFENGDIKPIPLPKDGRALFDLEHGITQTENKENKGSYFTLIRWEETYKASAHNLWHHTIPMLRKFAKAKNLKPEHLRIVFFFDN